MFCEDGLLMYSVAEPVSPLNTYKKGKISQSFGSTLGRNLLINTMTSIQPSDIPQRKFQAGEKFWVTSYTIQADGVVFQFFSDPYEDTRYYGELKFPFPKGQPPPADEIFKTIAEVVTVQPADNAGSGPTAAPAPGPPAPQPAAEQSQMRPIPPPPPPSDAPPPAAEGNLARADGGASHWNIWPATKSGKGSTEGNLLLSEYESDISQRQS